MMIHCNLLCHWLGEYTKWSLLTGRCWAMGYISREIYRAMGYISPEIYRISGANQFPHWSPVICISVNWLITYWAVSTVWNWVQVPMAWYWVYNSVPSHWHLDPISISHLQNSIKPLHAKLLASNSVPSHWHLDPISKISSAKIRSSLYVLNYCGPFY